ncbi:TetR/AcrR family transcriptional regulator [Microcoleus sp. FACHB-672]|uniref:TetR/AcrR family transcriptional regulator n=1 Tax=Microcoleus sp. FACHB-672 TaxID=2692825 RepID=UPI001686C9A8|nr:TetR/AcrR family transcriptional regulator [Microcoleus sp. FACHB-672]MBD2040045.1 TetR family transcriptional regulator C-terminal domain-containing protein [Microcoleus sp. FACHB-672]
MGKETTKTTLLEIGTRIILEKGFNHTGIQEILQTAGVPKGSFYYYFKSKEDFGLQVLENYAQAYQATLERCLEDQTLTPLSRLRRHFEESCKRFESRQCRNGCLIGNLSQELADQSEIFRSRLEEILSHWRERFAKCLYEAQEAGEIPSDLNPHDLAEFLLNSWEGAILRAKVTKTIAPLEAFIQIVFESTLKG